MNLFQYDFGEALPGTESNSKTFHCNNGYLAKVLYFFLFGFNIGSLLQCLLCDKTPPIDLC